MPLTASCERPCKNYGLTQEPCGWLTGYRFIHGMNAHICRTLSTLCFQAGVFSVILSIAIWWFLDHDTPEAVAHAERFGIFVGLWAPTLLILSNRFDRHADRAKPLPSLSSDLDEPSMPS